MPPCAMLGGMTALVVALPWFALAMALVSLIYAIRSGRRTRRTVRASASRG